MTMDEIATRVEQLSGPCRETDFLIAEAISMVPEHWAGCRTRRDNPVEFYEAGEPWPYTWEWGQPAYTVDLNAAMSLVPKGCMWTMDSWSRTQWGAGIWRHQKGWLIHSDIDHQSQSPALALTAAALKARAQEAR